jgi:hypothetical protein
MKHPIYSPPYVSSRKFCSRWVPWQLTDEQTIHVMLLQRYEEHGEALLSTVVTTHETWVFHYTPEGKAGWITWKLPHSPTGNIYIYIVSKESGCYCSLRRLRCSVGWFLYSPFNNKFSYLSGNSEETQGESSARDQDAVHRSSSFARQYSPSQYGCNREFLDLVGLGYSSHLPYSPDLYRQTSICSQEWRSTSNVRTSTPIKMFRQFVSLKDLTNWYIAMVIV